MKRKEETAIEELIASYADILAAHGPTSAEAEQFLAEHRSISEFGGLAETAKRLCELYETEQEHGYSGLRLPIRGSRSFFERLLDLRVAAVVVIAIAGATTSFFAVQNLESNRQVYAELNSIRNELAQARTEFAAVKKRQAGIRTAIAAEALKTMLPRRSALMMSAGAKTAERPEKVTGGWHTIILPVGSKVLVPAGEEMPLTTGEHTK